MSRATILLWSGEAPVRREYALHLAAAGYRTVEAAGLPEGLRRLGQADLALVDVRGDVTAEAVLADFRRRALKTTLLFLASRWPLDEALAAMRAGAFDLLTWPIDPPALSEAVRRGLAARRSLTRILRLSRELQTRNRQLRRQQSVLRSEKVALEARVRELTLVREIGGMLETEPDFRAACRAMLQRVAEFLGAEKGALLLFDHEGDAPCLRIQETGRDDVLRLPVSREALERFQAHRAPVVIGGGEFRSQLLGAFGRPESPARILILPLSGREAPVGHLVLLCPASEDPAIGPSQLLTIVAQQAAALVEKVRLREAIAQEREDLRQANRRLRILHDLSRTVGGSLDFFDILDEVAAGCHTLMPYHLLSLLLRQGEAVSLHQFSPQPIREDFCRLGRNRILEVWAAREGRNGGSPPEEGLTTAMRRIEVSGPLDLPAAPTPTGLTIPLRAGGLDWGILDLLRLDGRPPAPSEEQAVRTLAASLALGFRNAMQYRQVREEALTDPLTGLANRRAFLGHLRREFGRARRYREAMSLLLLDLDHFKAINDRYGHRTGDETLRHIAQLLIRSCRLIDFVARYGGEEFALILPEAARPEAHQVAQRIRTAVQQRFMCGGREIALTVSIGIASTPAPEIRSEGDLLEQADQALYRAKRNGRNRVEPAEVPVLVEQG